MRLNLLGRFNKRECRFDTGNCVSFRLERGRDKPARLGAGVIGKFVRIPGALADQKELTRRFGNAIIVTGC